ncbi:MAG: LysM peptidoglycan-binding domain-containing protein [Planctomycetes bacterium]|nr:LysM peptidoglycan-binding domain-containing protein [Planctomycetota bacterium]
MKTDRLLLVAIVAVMAAVVGYLFFSDEAAPGGRGDSAALQSAAGEPRTTLGAFEEQKRLEKARQGCSEFELPSDFKGRSAEDIAELFGRQPSMASRISTANGVADGFRAGQKVFVPADWIAARQTSSGAGGANPLGGSNPLVSGETVAAADQSPSVGAENNGRPSPITSPVGELPKGELAQDPPVARDEVQKPVARANDPSETPRPWSSFLMKKVPVSGSGATVNPTEARAREASATTKPTPGQSYRAVSGDTLWKIAEAAYGKGSRYKEIARANEALVGADGSLLRAGMVLRIP